MNKLFFLIWITLLFSLSLAAKEPKIFTTFVYADGGESIDQLLFDKYKLPVEILYDKNYIYKVKRWNLFVKDTNRLLPNERVYIELPFRYKIYFERFNPPRRTLASAPVKVKTSSAPVVQAGISQDYMPPSKNLNWSVFATTSIGEITDENKEVQVEGNSSQNSPLTLGFGLTFKSDNPRISYSSSFYMSYLVGATQGQANDVEIPLELGTNFYMNYRYKDLKNIYFGLDAERLSSFNTESVQNSQTFFTKEHSILYATFGHFDLYSIFGKKFFTKISISQSLSSQTNVESTIDNSPYSGIKGILFTSTRIYKNFTMHLLLKQHILSGPSNLSISRYGLGIGYQFY